MLTRRQFLIGSAAGLILPDWLLKAEQFLRNEGEPLLEAPEKTTDVLSAISDEGENYILSLNYDPDVYIRYTWRELIEKYIEYYKGEPVEYWIEEVKSLGFNGNLDEYVDDTLAFDYWLSTESPDLKAFQLLENLDLGVKGEPGSLAGSLIFTYGYHPGDGSPHVIARDDLTLSLLQKKLNDLNTGVEVIARNYP